MRHAILVLLVLLPVFLSPSTINAAPVLGTLNVRSSDLPKGSVMTIQATLTTAQAAKADQVSTATYKKLGIVLVNERGFDVASSGSHPYLYTQVILMSSVTSAQTYFATQVQRVVKMNDASARPLRLGRLGDQRFAETEMDSQTGKRAPAVFIALRQGRYLLVLGVFGLTTSFTSSKAIRLATLVDTRLKAAVH